jgi:predicted metal-dependent HD superfamily phosphohydrolase
MAKSNEAGKLVKKATSHWTPLAGRLGLADAIFADLTAAYGESHRRYHTLVHIVEMLDCHAQSRHLADNPDTIDLAIWFHDCIYDATLDHGENERLSAEHLGAVYTGDCSAAAQALILHSAGHAASDDPDIQLFCDLDLYRLGVPFETFDQHGRDVRVEYAQIAEDVWTTKRNAFFQALLDRPVIYQTDYWRSRMEKQARENLSRTIQSHSG